MARRAVEALNRVHAHIIGVLLNRMPLQGDSAYYYYYHYGDYSRPDAGSGGGKGKRSRSGGRPAEAPTAAEAGH
jgi:hypothetical protein